MQTRKRGFKFIFSFPELSSQPMLRRSDPGTTAHAEEYLFLHILATISEILLTVDE